MVFVERARGGRFPALCAGFFAVLVPRRSTEATGDGNVCTCPRACKVVEVATVSGRNVTVTETPRSLSGICQGKGTALHHATHSGHPEVVAMLLEKGADPKAQDNRGERPGDKFDPEVRSRAVKCLSCA